MAILTVQTDVVVLIFYPNKNCVGVTNFHGFMRLSFRMFVFVFELPPVL